MHEQLLTVLDVPVDEGILRAEGGVPHDLVEDSDLLIVLLAVLVEIVADLQVAEFALHPLVHLWEVQHVLSSILNHIFGEWSLFPEGVIALHDDADLFLLGMCHVDILLQEMGEGDVIVRAINQLLRLVLSLLNNSMRDLRVEDEIADKVILVNQGGLVLTKVMEDLHYSL